MRRLLIAGLSLAVTQHAVAQNITQDNVARVNQIIEAAVAAHGGEQLAGLETLLIEQKTTGAAVNQSLKPEPPWDRNRNAGYAAIDLVNERFGTRNNGIGGGFEFDNGSIINGENSFQLDHRAGIATPVAEPDYDTTSGPFIRVTPALLLRQLQAHARTAHFLGETTYQGRPHSVVGFAMEVGPAISLYFDQQSNLLTHSERVLPGFGLVEYAFLDYEEVQGIPFNQRFELHVNGDLNLERSNTAIRVNVPIDKFLEVGSGLTQVAALGPDEMSREALADGVYLIGGSGTYGLFVEMGDYVVAIGGTGGISDRIAQLREVIPDKPIRYGVMTHHHNDHLLAVPAYVTEGATVIGATSHAAVIRAAAGEDNGEQMKLETVAERRVLGAGSKRIEIIDVGPTAHTEHLLVAWLPEHQILFEADHFSMPRSGPVRPAVTSTRSFAEALQRHELEPAVLVSAHSPRPGTMADLKAAIALQPKAPAAR